MAKHKFNKTFCKAVQGFFKNRTLWAKLTLEGITAECYPDQNGNFYQVADVNVPSDHSQIRISIAIDKHNPKTLTDFYISKHKQEVFLFSKIDSE